MAVSIQLCKEQTKTSCCGTMFQIFEEVSNVYDMVPPGLSGFANMKVPRELGTGFVHTPKSAFEVFIRGTMLFVIGIRKLPRYRGECKR
jgi:hypothetical protein